MNDLIRIFIGYDPREAAAYHVCVQSIIESCADPNLLEFHPVTGNQRDGSNRFIYQRFLVPWACGFRGYAIFMDGDMIVRDDIQRLWDLRPCGYQAVSVVKHDYQTKYPTKYLGYKNENYQRKNWTSVMVWDCGFFPNRVLTPEFVASKGGAYLHRLSWLKDLQIGELPSTWNRLVLEQELTCEDKLRHFTIGIPAFSEYAGCDGAEEWWQTYRHAIAPITEP